jgi:hypothetical protein
VAAAAGDAEGSARLSGGAERLRESLGSQPGPTGAAVAEQYLSLAREVLGERFAALEAEGRNLSLEDAVALAAV